MRTAGTLISFLLKITFNKARLYRDAIKTNKQMTVTYGSSQRGSTISKIHIEGVYMQTKYTLINRTIYFLRR